MLEEFQEAMVLLWTDRQWREDFFSSPHDTLDEFCLEPQEREALLELSREGVERYARGLLHKRWRAVRHQFPRSLGLVPSLEQIYIGWLETHPAEAQSSLLSYGAQEALRALPALREALFAREDIPEFVPDLLAFEVLRRCSTSDGKRRHLQSSWRLEQWLARGTPERPEATSIEYLFDGPKLRWRQGGRL